MIVPTLWEISLANLIALLVIGAGLVGGWFKLQSDTASHAKALALIIDTLQQTNIAAAKLTGIIEELDNRVTRIEDRRRGGH